MFQIERWWNRKWTGLLIVGFTLFFLCFFIYALTNDQFDFGYNDGYQPSQPIPFSHKLHVGKYQMDCRYCHTSVEQSRYASVPSLNICMNCHINVKVNSPWIQKIRTAYENNQSIEWKKVHLLPDFVKFNHAPHIKALTASKNIHVIPDPSSFQATCQTCHGPIETMDTVYQHKDLSMGWCVQCHREQDNKPWLLQCSTCHY